jgi:hypothetical protein
MWEMQIPSSLLKGQGQHSYNKRQDSKRSYLIIVLHDTGYFKIKTKRNKGNTYKYV